MAAMYEHLKNLLFDIDKFLQETLKKENISKSCKEQKQNLLDKLGKLFEEYPNLAPAERSLPEKNKDVDKTDESQRTGGSSVTDEGEDPYSDQTIPDLSALDIKDESISGFLEKKQRKGTFLVPAKFQKRWCVVKDGIFYYYESKKDKKQKGAFYIADYTFRNAPDLAKETNKKELCFELVYPSKRTYQFMASNTEDYQKWHDFIMVGDNLIEEDIYEPIECEDTAQDVYDDGDAGEIYDAAGDITERVEENKTEDLEEDDVYEDTANTLSDDTPIKSPPPLPPTKTRGKPPPPPPDDTPPAPPLPRSAPPPPPRQSNKAETSLLEEVDVALKPKMKIVPPKEDFENMYYGKWDFIAETGDELTFKKGDIVHVISKEFDQKSWWVGEMKGCYGLVPKAHLIPAYEKVAG